MINCLVLVVGTGAAVGWHYLRQYLKFLQLVHGHRQPDQMEDKYIHCLYSIEQMMMMHRIQQLQMPIPNWKLKKYWEDVRGKLCELTNDSFVWDKRTFLRFEHINARP